MAVFTPPSFPVIANLWYYKTSTPPSGQKNLQLHISISPVSWKRWSNNPPYVCLYQVTHVIRCPFGTRITDSGDPQDSNSIFPCSIWEVPADSGSYYATLFAHKVGAGFANQFARAYVTRAGRVNPGFPTYDDWY